MWTIHYSVSTCFTKPRHFIGLAVCPLDVITIPSRTAATLQIHVIVLAHQLSGWAYMARLYVTMRFYDVHVTY